MFAPDGSLLQVEYAQAVAAKGAPAVAVVAAGGRSVVLATVAEENDNEDENNGDSNPQDDDTSPSWDEDQIHSEASVMRTASEKLLQLDDHVWVAVRFEARYNLHKFVALNNSSQFFEPLFYLEFRLSSVKPGLGLKSGRSGFS